MHEDKKERPIGPAVHTQEKILSLLSEHFVKSGWVRYEVELALARENHQHREILFPSSP
jgi:hypothetical protein